MIKNRTMFLPVFSIVMLLMPFGLRAENYPPVGLAALANIDHLWKWNGKTRTAMSSSTDVPLGNKDKNNFH